MAAGSPSFQSWRSAVISPASGIGIGPCFLHNNSMQTASRLHRCTIQHGEVFGGSIDNLRLACTAPAIFTQTPYCSSRFARKFVDLSRERLFLHLCPLDQLHRVISVPRVLLHHAVGIKVRPVVG